MQWMGFLIQQTWLRGATHSMRESIPLIVELFLSSVNDSESAKIDVLFLLVHLKRKVRSPCCTTILGN